MLGLFRPFGFAELKSSSKVSSQMAGRNRAAVLVFIILFLFLFLIKKV